jgi:MFS family permease
LRYSHAVAAILGGVLASTYMQESFFVQAGILFFLIPLAFLLKEPKVHKEQIHEKATSIHTAVKFALNDHKEIKWLIFYAGFLGASTLANVWFSQPFWQHVGVPIALFGVLWASLSGLRGVFAHLAPKFEKFAGRKNALISLIFFPFLGYLGLGIFQNFIWAIVFFLFFQFAFAVSTPVIKDYINRLTASNIRATVLSVQSMVQRLIFAAVGPFLGWSLDAFSFREAFFISAFFFFGAGIICILFLQKHKVLVK